MKRTVKSIAFASILASALHCGAATAQQALVGAWTVVSSDTIDASGKRTPTWGPNPRGSLIFTANGRYSLTLARSSLTKFASNNRTTGTTKENEGVVQGSLSHFGTYTADAKSFTYKVETATFPNWDGTTQNRPYTISGDQLKYTTPAASGGGSAELVWKRVK